MLKTYDYVTLLLVAVIIPHDHHASVFLSDTEAVFLHSMARKEATVKQKFQPGMCQGENAVKEAWRDWWILSYKAISEVYFMQNRAMSTGAGYEIMESFDDPKRFP